MSLESLQIGEVARRTGLSIDAIRFYEKAGLLSRSARTKGGYRVYQQRELADLEFIQKAKQLDFSLKEIHELFSIQRHPKEACEHVEHLIANKLMIVRTKIRELHTLESGLAHSLKQYQKALRQSTKAANRCPGLEEIAAPRPERNKA